MCLFYNENSTKRFKSKRKGMRTIVCYKVLRRSCDNTLHSQYYEHEWQLGWNVSDRLGTDVQYTEQYENKINTGIHVYTDYQTALYSSGHCYPVVPVTCRMKDLVGCSRQDGTNQAVFTKVFLTKKAYKKALRRKV